MHKYSTILLIGSGRLALHLKHWNNLLEKPNHLLFWDRSQSSEKLAEYLKSAALVWLAISDKAIVPFFETLLAEAGVKVIHFSGALSDPRLCCAHPLMSFPLSLLPDDSYRQICFVVEAPSELSCAMPGFKNKFTVLSTENKSYYHALCVLAGNFPQLLWNEIAGKMQQLHLPPEGLDLYIKQITDNYINLKDLSLTGPIARRDFLTIDKNLDSLSESPKLKNIYSIFTKEFNS